jgi:AraC-like DNA-binding protein
VPSPSGPEPPPASRFCRAAGTLGGRVPAAVGYEPSGPVVAAAGVEPRLHRGLPSATLTLIFSLAGPVVTAATPAQLGGPDVRRTLVLVGGLHVDPAYVLADPGQAGVQLALHPLAARALLGVPAVELTALVSDGADVLGPDAERLRERLSEVGWEGRFALLGEHLRARLAATPTRAAVRPELAEAWRWLAARRGQGRVADLAAHVALSPRQLHTLFTREVGRGPKTVARLMRFEHVTTRVGDAVRAGRRVDLSAVAYACGYADHSHLDREFSSFVGTGPAAWLAEERRNLQAGGHQHAPGSSS